MTREELEKLKPGENIHLTLTKYNKIFLGIVNGYFITCHVNGSNPCSHRLDECLDYSVPPKPKKRYWLWDVEDVILGACKLTTYVDEEGFNTAGRRIFEKENLIKKHENEFVEVDE